MVEQRINSEVQIKMLIDLMNNPPGISPSKGFFFFYRDLSKIIGGKVGRSREGVGHQFLNPW